MWSIYAFDFAISLDLLIKVAQDKTGQNITAL